MRRVLSFVKYREDSGGRCAYDGTPHCYGGLYNSALFVVEMLQEMGVKAKLVQVCDSNDIDREVTKFKPDTVIIEGLWVVPGKFAELAPLHPKVQWFVRIHSEIPFLAYEGVAMDWIAKYAKQKNVFVSSNSRIAERDLGVLAKVIYLPNYYPPMEPELGKSHNGVLDVGCFGAIRPLKNQLLQAFAAIAWAKKKALKLRFHVNGRVEQGGDRVLKNLRALLPATGNELVEHPWAPRPEFLKRIAKMDVGMQVSFSETFDITAADTVAMNVPLVASHQVHWCAPGSKAVPTDMQSIVDKLQEVTGHAKKMLQRENSKRLMKTSREAMEVWRKFAA